MADESLAKGQKAQTRRLMDAGEPRHESGRVEHGSIDPWSWLDTRTSGSICVRGEEGFTGWQDPRVLAHVSASRRVLQDLVAC